MHVKPEGWGYWRKCHSVAILSNKKFILYSGVDPGWGGEGEGAEIIISGRVEGVQKGDPKQLYTDERPLAFFSFPCTGYIWPTRGGKHSVIHSDTDYYE